MHADVARAEFMETLTGVGRRIRTAFNARVVAHGLTYARARTLFCLSRLGRLTQSELAAELELENATVVRLLDGMEKLHLISRLPVENDRRAKHVVLTKHGQAQADIVATIAAELRDEIIGDIATADLRGAAAVLRTLAKRLDPAS
ncbi:MarR family winged helix-turn-helix transcriptional regulator [Mangrovicella endophytica]|uniref:MarR family winged helix-turn-helix transcriptional regulator n=1 Tax=Mangrovicella endophytica TaxID=2066697 RepID=UPI000C9E2DF1|nr:MarR family transcriptional regulator [Mangrovicella endophytica]